MGTSNGNFTIAIKFRWKRTLLYTSSVVFVLNWSNNQHTRYQLSSNQMLVAYLS